MIKNNISWIVKTMSVTLIILGLLTGILIISQIGTLKPPTIIGAFVVMMYFTLLPILLKHTKTTSKAIMLSAAVLTAPLVLIVSMALVMYIYGVPFDMTKPLFFIGTIPIGIGSFMIAWLVFFFHTLALGFYLQPRKHTS